MDGDVPTKVHLAELRATDPTEFARAKQEAAESVRRLVSPVFPNGEIDFDKLFDGDDSER